MSKNYKSKAKLWLVLIILIAGVVVYEAISPTHLPKINTTNKPAIVKLATEEPNQADLAKLQLNLNTVMGEYPADTVSISLINMPSNAQYNFGSTEIMPGASSTKIIPASDYLHQVELGQASLNQEFNGQTALSLLQQMVQETSVNDSNSAWMDFLNYLTYDQVTSYGQSIGLKNFDSYNNTLTASDEAIVLEKIYEGKLLNKINTNLLLSFMQHTGDEDLIPAALPTGATVYHKYGYLDGYLHDAAIIIYKGHSFVLAIYTNNSSGTLGDYATREQLFHSITTDVIDYEIS